MPLDIRPRFSFLIANGGETVSTAQAYAALDIAPPDDHAGISSADCISALSESDVVGLSGVMYNRFAEVVLPLCPIATSMLQALKKTGAAALMSGSGSTVYGAYASRSEALAAQRALPFPTVYAETLYPSETRL
jgi:4-diphosphocytidyl-2C-methyl-D-erythritol kinase